ncbi:MAG: M50 family metallopeptidase [Acidobacteria bacterium]|nr:M50 family metallopeptidase [Acidobacteriota bacterium]
MRVRISQDARPQAMTLLAAAVISIVLWFIPFAEVLTYPFRIFVTFIHEGGHAIAALLTGNSVGSLSVAMNASGETYTTQGGLVSQTFVASAGYLGSMAFGGLLLVLDLKTVFFLSSPFATSVPTDAVNMANATGIPAFIWAIIWIAIALAILALAMRIYVVTRDSRIQPDLPFEDVLST